MFGIFVMVSTALALFSADVKKHHPKQWKKSEFMLCRESKMACESEGGGE
jgi:hypothetical protein